MPALSFTGHADALSWLDGEWESLVTSAVQCGRHGPRWFSWHLADALRRFFWLRSRFEACVSLAEEGLRAAEAELDLLGQAAMHHALGTAHLGLDCRHGIEHWQSGEELFRAAGNERGRSSCLQNLGCVHILLGRPGPAVAAFQRALELAGHPRLEITLLGNLSSALTTAGRLSAALGHYEQALEYLSETGDRVREVPILSGLADLNCQLGRLQVARDHIDRACLLAPQSGSNRWVLSTLRVLVTMDRDTGRYEQVLANAQRLLDLETETAAFQYTLDALNVIGQVHHHFGRYDEAVKTLERGLSKAQAMGKAYQETSLTINLARALLATGDHQAATGHAEAALQLAREREFRIYEGRALTTLAAGAEHDERARELAQMAYAIQRVAGRQLGTAEALFVLGRTGEARKIFARFTGDGKRAPAGTLGDRDLGHRRLSECN